MSIFSVKETVNKRPLSLIRQRYMGDDGSIQERPNPRDLKLEEIATKAFDRIEGPDATSVKYACGILYKSIKLWMRLLPCRLWWHAPFPNSNRDGHKVCRRCGTWK